MTTDLRVLVMYTKLLKCVYVCVCEYVCICIDLLVLMCK